MSGASPIKSPSQHGTTVSAPAPAAAAAALLMTGERGGVQLRPKPAFNQSHPSR